MRQIIAATKNKAKIAALQRLLGDAAEVVPPPHDISPEDQDHATALAVAEEGRTVEEIAAAKAAAWSRVVPGELVIASDGGLVIPALGDAWDPTRTRRFAGDEGTDLERAHKLVALAAHLRGDDRRISWREAVAIACNGEVLGQWSAESEPGLLATEVDLKFIEQSGGFWVDTLWICPENGNRRLLELYSEERIALGDHWSRLQSPVRAFVNMNR